MDMRIILKYFFKKCLLRKNILLGAVLLLFGIIIFMSWHEKSQKGETSRDLLFTLSEIRAKTPEVFEYIRDNLVGIISQKGEVSAIQLAKDAFQNEAINMYQCHLLAHLIGHAGSFDTVNQVRATIPDGLEFCEGGYAHGLESEIVHIAEKDGNDPQFREKLYRFCEFLQSVSFPGGCYHGAGHAFLRDTLNIKKAISLCDTLTGGPVKDFSNCYNGIFSEYTNLIASLDSETGLRFPEGAPIHLSTSPLDFCASFPQRNQIPCALEVSANGVSPNSSSEEVDHFLKRCTEGTHSIELQSACIQSVAALYIQHGLPRQNTMIPSSYALSLPTNLRQAYLAGAAGEIGQFIKNGARKDWKMFCVSFPKKEDQQLCLQIIGSHASKNTFSN